MRRLVANFFLSLDGVMEAPDEWQFPYFSDEMGRATLRPSPPATPC